MRAHRSEGILRNSAIQADMADLAKQAGEAAIAGARSLGKNDFKIPLVRNLVSRAVRATTA
jgi:CO/xanthine dehydrogenase FAD-binding subunit